MSQNGEVHGDGQRLVLLATTTITGAVTAVVTTPITLLTGMMYLVMQAQMAVGTGGTSIQAWVQTSIDGGTTWIDVATFAFANTPLRKVSAVNGYIAPAAQAFTATDGTLADNTIQQGVLGNRVRLKYTSVGTYSGGTTLTVNAIAKG